MRTANHEDIGNDWPETTILPEQFLGGSPEGSPLRGVKGLLVAILEDAIRGRSSRGLPLTIACDVDTPLDDAVAAAIATLPLPVERA